MPTVELTLTAQQVARLAEAWGEAGVPLQASVLKALARATKQEIRRTRELANASAYEAASNAAIEAEESEFGTW